MSEEPQRRDLRASDAEREGAAEALRTAASEGRLQIEELEERLQTAYTVRTRRELEELLADVTVPGTVATRSDSGLTVREGDGGSRWILAIMSGHDHRGRWRVGRRCTAINVMGGSTLDLNDAELADRAVQMNVISIMGGGEIRVPHGVDVQVSHFSVMGGNDVRLGDEVAPPGAPQIRIRMISIMGGTSVRRGRKRKRSDRERER